MCAYSTRPLTIDEWQDLRDMRLKALQDHAGVFGSSYERERANGQQDWEDWLSQDKKCIFGLFTENVLVGITGIITDRDDPTGQTAKMVASYIAPEHRGKGLSALLYEARIEWAKTQENIKRITVGHRTGNEASKRANQAFGFQYIAENETAWPDGQTDNEVCYELKL